MKVKFLALFLLFWTTILFGQNPSKPIKEDIDNFAKHIDANPDLAFFYINRAYSKSVAIASDSLIGRSLYNLGYYYYTKNNFPEAKKNFNQAIPFAIKSRFYKILCMCYNQLGMIASETDKFDVGLQYYFKALKISDNSKLVTLKSKVLLNLGNLYLLQKDSAKALDYYKQNIANAQKNVLDKELSQGYVTVAALREPSNKPEAVLLYKKALVIAQKNKDLDTQIRTHIYLSNLYLNDDKNSFLDKVYYHLQEATKINEVLKDNSMLFCIYFNHGACYFNKKEYDKALFYYNKSLFLSKKNIESTQRLHLYEVMANLYIQKKDYKNGFIFNEKYNKLKDSVFDVEKNKSFKEIETKFEVDKKNLKIELLTKDTEIQKNSKRIIILVGFVLFVLALGRLFFLRERLKNQRFLAIKRKKLHVQEVIKLQQKQELERVNAILEGQDQERSRLSKEIHDGIGGSLAGIKLQLAQENDLLKNEKIDLVINQMADTFDELRLISHNLSINFFNAKELQNSIYVLSNEYQDRNKFKINVSIYPDDCLNLLSNPVKHHVYRIIQELLANVAKHAHANQVLMHFTKHESFLNIIFEDDGKGFGNNKANGIGIKNIKERIVSLKGTVEIESNYGKGTTIIIDIPTNE